MARVVKYRWMRWAEYVACMGKRGTKYIILVEKLGRDQLEDLGILIRGRIM
jgi:hypothetical protein